MAKMNGCNQDFDSAKSPQGVKRVTPSSFARNNMSKGGTNDHLGGTTTAGKRLPISKGKAHDGKP